MLCMFNANTEVFFLPCLVKVKASSLISLSNFIPAIRFPSLNGGCIVSHKRSSCYAIICSFNELKLVTTFSLWNIMTMGAFSRVLKKGAKSICKDVFHMMFYSAGHFFIYIDF